MVATLPGLAALVLILKAGYAGIGTMLAECGAGAGLLLVGGIVAVTACFRSTRILDT